MQLRRTGLTTLLITLLVILSTPLSLDLLALLQSPQASAQTSSGRKAEANRLLNSCIEQKKSTQVQVAIQTCQQALEIYKSIGDSVGQARVLINLGLAYDSLKQYSKAVEYYQLGLTIFRAIQNSSGEATTLLALGSTYLNLGQYLKAVEHHQQALKIYRAVGNPGGEALVLHLLGLAYGNLNQYPKAIEHYQQALTIHRTIVPDRGLEAEDLKNLGIVYNASGQYSEAIRYHQQALVIFRALREPDEEGDVLKSLGGAYQNLGQFPQAVEHYKQALKTYQTVRNPAEEALVLTLLGNLYNFIGQYQKASEYLQQALTIYQTVRNPYGEVLALTSLGQVYNFLKQYSKATEYFQQALTIRAIRTPAGRNETLNSQADRTKEAAVLASLGLAYHNQGQHSKAIEALQQALTIYRTIRVPSGEAASLNGLGIVHYYGQGQFQKAMEYYQQALTISRRIRDPSVESVSLSLMGEAFLKAGKVAEAEKTLRAGVEAYESLRPGLGDADKVAFTEMASAHTLLEQALIAQNKPEAALEIAERGRARALAELLAGRLAPNSNPQLAINSPSVRQIQQTAKTQNATLVEYSIAYESVKGKNELRETQLFIWVIKPTGEVAFRKADLKQPKTSFKELVFDSRLAIGARGRGLSREPQSSGNQAKQLQQLHQLLIAPIADLLPTDPKARVVFLPQEDLFLVPFPALQDKLGKYLIEKHTITTAPSIQVLDLTRQQRQKVSGKRALIVGNPAPMPKVTLNLGDTPVPLSNLPGAEQEANAIASLLGTQALTKQQATKAAVVKRLGQARFVHLATHGLLDDFKGLGVPGAIALASTSKDDGLLTAGDLLNLKLKAELVVLSACDTGRGKITGDGVIGLSRSLISAGAPSIVVSLWKVPDAPTGLLMTEFYRNLKQNPDKAQALRQAILITKQRHPNPADWSGFTLIGEAR